MIPHSQILRSLFRARTSRRWLFAAILSPAALGCAAQTDDPVDTDVFTSLQELAAGDDCDSTAQCIVKYGAAASDCKNSQSAASVCVCANNQPCEAEAPAPPTPSGTRLVNKGHNLALQSDARSDGSSDAFCGGPDAQNVRAGGNGSNQAEAFELIPATGDWFHIQSRDGLYLQVTGEVDITGSDSSAVRLVEASCSGNWTQWRTVDAGSGFVRLENRASGLWLQALGATDRDSGEGKQVRAVPNTFTGDLTRWSLTDDDNSSGSGGGTGSGGASSGGSGGGTGSGGASSGGSGGNGASGGSGGLGPSDPGNPANYTGQTHWNASTKTLTFTTSGNLPNTHHGWDVPTSVKKLVIGKNVRVTGRFDVTSTIEITGEDRTSSVLYGTPLQGYNKNNDGCGECKSAVRGDGNILVTVRNFTSLNPFGFHFTGKRGAKFLVDKMRAIDDRDGHGNNSDGISAADGTIVRDSYFESGDDIIKVYADIEVINTEIKMVTNTVPIQFGWGSYGSGARGVFKNLKVTGSSGRHADNNALISGRAGTYNKSIVIDGLDYRNPNGSMMVFRESHGSADITVTDALIQIQEFRGPDWSMNVDPNVCRTTYPSGRNAPNQFDCRN